MGKMEPRVAMIPRVEIAILVLILSTLCAAQEGLTVHAKGKQKCPAAEAQKICRSACSVVQRELGATHSVAPRLTLVLGADTNEVAYGPREIRLTKWDRNPLCAGSRNACLRGCHARSQDGYGEAGPNLGRRNDRGGTRHLLASFKVRVAWDAAHNFPREEKNHDEDRLA